MGRKRQQKGVCPRCGRPINYFEKHRKGGQEYVIAVHYLGYEKLPSGKVRKKVDKCYLGPASSYIYVSKTHEREGLVFYGASEQKRIIYYIDMLITALRNYPLDKNECLRLSEKFFELAMVLRGKAHGERRN